MTTTLAGVGPYSRKTVETSTGYSSSSFELPNDERQQLVQNFHHNHDKTNVSMSVNPSFPSFMVGCVTHLSFSGLSCYTEELVRTIRSISVIAGSGATVIPAIHILLGGVTCPYCPMLVRQLMTLDSWILSSQLPPNLTPVY